MVLLNILKYGNSQFDPNKHEPGTLNYKEKTQTQWDGIMDKRLRTVVNKYGLKPSEAQYLISDLLTETEIFFGRKMNDCPEERRPPCKGHFQAKSVKNKDGEELYKCCITISLKNLNLTS